MAWASMMSKPALWSSAYFARLGRENRPGVTRNVGLEIPPSIRLLPGAELVKGALRNVFNKSK